MDEASLTEAVRLRRSQQKELIDRLKSQLRELEQYAFENGEAGVPQDVVLERQRVILNELKTRMNLEIDERNYHQVCGIWSIDGAVKAPSFGRVVRRKN
jgi:hypothetical protein